MFDADDGTLAQLELDQVKFLDQNITQLEARIRDTLAAIPEAQGVDADGTTGPAAGTGPDAPVLPAAARLAEIPRIRPGPSRHDHRRDRHGHDPVPHRPAPGLLGRAMPRCDNQSGKRDQDNARRKRATGTWRGALRRDRHSAPPVPRPAKAPATAASPAAAARPKPRSPSPAPPCSTSTTSCSSSPAIRYTDLGPDYYDASRDKPATRRSANHVGKLEALGLRGNPLPPTLHPGGLTHTAPDQALTGPELASGPLPRAQLR